MFENFKKNHGKRQLIPQALDMDDPIDQQILKLMDANQLSVDVIDLDEPLQEKKKPRKTK